MASRFVPRFSALLLGAAALLVGGCSEYYTPPPPISVTVTANSTILPIVTASGANQLTLTATVNNSSNQSVTWSLQSPTCTALNANSSLGSIGSTGIYTAPLSLPVCADGSLVTAIAVVATPAADPTRPGQWALTLENPPAVITQISPNVTTQGQTIATLTLTGTGFYSAPTAGANPCPAATLTSVALNGAAAQSVVLPAPSTSGSGCPGPNMGASAIALNNVSVTGVGALSVQASNPDSSNQGNPGILLSQPASLAASSSIAVLYDQTAQANKAYVPVNNTIAVVNLDTQAEIASIAMPSAFTPSAAAADPATDQVAVISATDPRLVVIDADTDTIAQTYTMAPSGTATFSDGTACTTCAILVDSIHDRALVDTASGFASVDLSNGTYTPLPLTPAADDVAAENFAYDPLAEQLYIPFYGNGASGLNVANLSSDAVQSFTLPAGTSEPDALAIDPATQDAVLADEAADGGNGDYLSISFNGFASGAPGSAAAPVAIAQTSTTTNGQTTWTADCPGAGAWDEVTIDLGSHLGFFGNEGQCVAVAALPTNPSNAVPAQPQPIHWLALGESSAKAQWKLSSAPHSVTTYEDMSGGQWGLALLNDGQGNVDLAKVDLKGTLAATALPSGDGQEVSPANLVTYIPLH